MQCNILQKTSIKWQESFIQKTLKQDGTMKPKFHTAHIDPVVHKFASKYSDPLETNARHMAQAGKMIESGNWVRAELTKGTKYNKGKCVA